jgi:3-oxoacyl-[acyl-carrier-protein] synthase II
MGQYSSKIACPISDFSPMDYVENTKDLKHLGRTSQLALVGAKLALEDARLRLGWRDNDGRCGKYFINDIDPERIGVILGAGAENMDLCEKYHERFLAHHGPKRVSPYALPQIIISSVPANISNRFGLMGKMMLVSSACASSTHAVIEAFLQLQLGKEDIILTGGADACITPYIFGGFDVLRAMSTRNGEPEAASRPYDTERDGFVMGEGAGLLVLEDRDHALKRGAHIYCELTGFGATSDATHIVAPDRSGNMLAKAITDAIEMSRVHPAEIDYVNAHGTSTPLNDSAETSALKKSLGEAAYRVPISATKSMTGHLMGGAGGIEIIATALMLERGKIHATLNLERPGDDCDLDYVPKVCRTMSIEKALKISSAFGGYNAALVFQKVQPV